jgi:hypothetical protein
MSKRKWSALVVLSAYSAEIENMKKRENNIEEKIMRNIWVKDWVRSRETEGFCVKLLNELRVGETNLYHNFVRMTADQFDILLGLVNPFIQKKNTQLRQSISASDLLILTLRYLATGDNFRSLQYLFRIPQTTISRIIPEVLDAIYKVLVSDYVKVF